MAEELKPIGGETHPERPVGAREIGSGMESGPFGAPEQAPEKASEMATERTAETRGGTPTSATVAQTPADDEAVASDAKAVYDEMDAEARVTKLVSLAEAKGVGYAVRVARKLDDFYVLDRMHDELSGKFYDVLKAKGLVSE